MPCLYSIFADFSSLQLFGSVIVVALTISSYIQYKTTYNHWIKKRIKGPKPIPFFENFNFSPLMTKRIFEWVNQYGKVHGFYITNRPVLTVGKVDLLKDLLVRNFHKFSDHWAVATDPLETENLINQNLVLKYEFKRSPGTPDKPLFDDQSPVLAAKEMSIRVGKRV